MKLRLDINFGDPVTPGPGLIDLSALRPDTEAIRILGYPVETVLAEKLTTAIELGPASTRVRDYADIFMLTGTQTLSCAAVRAALLATAAFRETVIQPLSEAIQDIVPLRAGTYSAYRKRLGPDGARPAACPPWRVIRPTRTRQRIERQELERKASRHQRERFSNVRTLTLLVRVVIHRTRKCNAPLCHLCNDLNELVYDIRREGQPACHAISEVPARSKQMFTGTTRRIGLTTRRRV
jgi:hypothetical protein